MEARNTGDMTVPTSWTQLFFVNYSEGFPVYCFGLRRKVIVRMYGEYENIKIRGIASAVPARVVDNEECAEKLGSRRAKKQVMLTGIRNRHCVRKGQSASDLSCVSAEKLLQKLNWDRNEIRVIVNVTQSPDVHTPSTAMIIQKRLGIGQDCLAFDVNLGCTGYVSGLQIISALLQNTGGKGLLFAGDGQYSDMPEIPSTDSLLFGDGASATAIELEGGNPMMYAQKTDGTRHNLLSVALDGTLTMDGNSVLLFSLNEVCQSIRECKEHFSIDEESIDYYILHQAQKLILEGIAKECNIDPGKVLTSYEEYGNTSTATLPITICNNVEEIQKKKHVKLYLCGFGVGLSWSSVVVEMDTDCILPIEVTDYSYNDL